MASRTSFRERQRVAREHEILQVARRLLTTKGYHAMTMDEIADEVGIAKATLYSHYESKDDLAAAVMFTHLTSFIDWLEHGPDESETARAYLERVLRKLLHERYSYEGSLDLLPMQNDLSIVSLMMRRDDFLVHAHRLIELMSNVVARCQHEGAVRSSVRPSIVVHTILSMVQGGTYKVMVRHGELTVDELVDSLVQLLFVGIQAEE